MFLRYTTRKKNGKEHRSYSLVENRRCASGRVVQRHALYLGEINDGQQEAWRKTIEIFEEGRARPRTVALFPEERSEAVADEDLVRIRLSQLSLPRPRPWGACWLAGQLWEQLGLDHFWAQRLPPSRKGTRWDWVLQILAPYRLLDPGSEWRLYRHWFEHSALADLLGADLELADEVLAGHTSDKTTLADFLKKMEEQYGQAERIWVMDRGIPTEAVLEQMRAAQPPVQYLVGTPRGRLSQFEEKLAALPWLGAREGVTVKLLAEGSELYVLAESNDRVGKERAMRLRQLKGLWPRLQKLQQMKLQRDDLLKKLGAALHDFPVGARLGETQVPPQTATLTLALRRDKLRQARTREGRYLLRRNITAGRGPEELWPFYRQLTEVEAAFKSLKDDLSLRPLYHQVEDRIEAPIFISFLAYCLQVTLRRRLRDRAPGLTPRAVLEKFATSQMLDVHLPTTDGRTVILSRYTHPENEVQLLLQRLQLELPAQPPP